MKYKIPFLFSLFIIISCQKAKEEFQQIADETTQKVKERSSELVKEQVDKHLSETITSMTNAEEVSFQDVFNENKITSLKTIKGKKVALPMGIFISVFKYSADKDELLRSLENQTTENEAGSDKIAKKIDGKNIIEKIKLLKNLLPENSFDTSILDEISTDRSLEFYRLNRIPNRSTLIYDPKNNTFLHIVENDN